MNSSEIIITTVTIILTILSSLLGLFLKKNEKTKKYYETYLKIQEEIRKLCIVAEDNYNEGSKKKKYVISNINKYLVDNKLIIENEEIDNIIENIIKTSKSINTNARVK